MERKLGLEAGNGVARETWVCVGWVRWDRVPATVVPTWTSPQSVSVVQQVSFFMSLSFTTFSVKWERKGSNALPTHTFVRINYSHSSVKHP